MSSSPIIILGMHRSGTSMLASFLEKAGLFIGYKKEANNESVFFRDINEWVLKEANASWDNPINLQYIDTEFINYVTHIIQIRFKFFSYQFLGPKNTFRYWSINNLNIKWGWKDPRNSILWPLWKNIFPNARFIHIVRNPIDVAVSLQVRARKARLKQKDSRAKFRDIYTAFRLVKSNYTDSIVTFDLKYNINLWEYYINKILELEKDISNRDIIHVRYEDFLLSPYMSFKSILNFCSISIDDKKIKKIISRVNQDRRFVFFQDETLKKLYNSVKNRSLFKRFNYHNLL